MKTTWPEAIMIVGIWMAGAIMIVAMSHCEYKKTEAMANACKNSSCVF